MVVGQVMLGSALPRSQWQAASKAAEQTEDRIDQGEKEQGFYVAHPASLVLCSMVRQVAKAQVQRRGLRLQLDVSSSVLA